MMSSQNLVLQIHSLWEYKDVGSGKHDHCQFSLEGTAKSLIDLNVYFTCYEINCASLLYFIYQISVNLQFVIYPWYGGHL